MTASQVQGVYGRRLEEGMPRFDGTQCVVEIYSSEEVTLAGCQTSI